MDLVWLDDLIALAETDSLSAAAERQNCSQPAFSRRVKSIESWIGTPVLDRSSRPARLTQTVIDQMSELRAMAKQLRDLQGSLRSDILVPERISIATQHSLSVGWLPELLTHLLEPPVRSVARIYADNLEECSAKLMMRQVEVLIAYETESARIELNEALIEKVTIGSDEFVPVGATSRVLEHDADLAGPLPLIAYPADVFLGEVQRDILGGLSQKTQFLTVVETAMAPAVLGFALAGHGIAWLPRSLALPHLNAGTLSELSDWLPTVSLKVTAVRPRSGNRPESDRLWSRIGSYK